MSQAVDAVFDTMGDDVNQVVSGVTDYLRLTYDTTPETLNLLQRNIFDRDARESLRKIKKKLAVYTEQQLIRSQKFQVFATKLNLDRQAFAKFIKTPLQPSVSSRFNLYRKQLDPDNRELERADLSLLVPTKRGLIDTIGKQKKVTAENYESVMTQFKKQYGAPQSHFKFMEMFPQWAPDNLKKRNQLSTALNDRNRLLALAGNQNDPIMKDLHRMDPRVVWNASTGRWGGGVLDTYMLEKDPQKIAKKMAQSDGLLRMSLSADQVEQQVPKVVRQIMKANAHVGGRGFGPISSKSLSLYAGRWIDPITNRVRVLPQASSKTLNPLSREQKLGYFQARILNFWNSLVMTTQQYYNLLGQTGQDYYQKKTNSIKKQLDLDVVDENVIKRLQKVYIRYNLGLIKPTSNIYPIISNLSVLKEMRKISLLNSTSTAEEKSQALESLKRIIDEFTSSLVKEYGSQTQALPYLGRIIKGSNNLGNGVQLRLANGAKNALKAATIPYAANNVKQMMQAQQVYEAGSSAINKRINKGYGMATLTNDDKSMLSSLQSHMPQTLEDLRKGLTVKDPVNKFKDVTRALGGKQIVVPKFSLDSWGDLQKRLESRQFMRQYEQQRNPKKKPKLDVNMTSMVNLINQGMQERERDRGMEEQQSLVFGPLWHTQNQDQDQVYQRNSNAKTAKISKKDKSQQKKVKKLKQMFNQDKSANMKAQQAIVPSLNATNSFLQTTKANAIISNLKGISPQLASLINKRLTKFDYFKYRSSPYLNTSGNKLISPSAQPFVDMIFNLKYLLQKGSLWLIHTNKGMASLKSPDPVSFNDLSKIKVKTWQRGVNSTQNALGQLGERSQQRTLAEIRQIQERIPDRQYLKKLTFNIVTDLDLLTNNILTILGQLNEAQQGFGSVDLYNFLQQALVEEGTKKKALPPPISASPAESLKKQRELIMKIAKKIDKTKGQNIKLGTYSDMRLAELLLGHDQNGNPIKGWSYTGPVAFVLPHQYQILEDENGRFFQLKKGFVGSGKQQNRIFLQ